MPAILPPINIDSAALLSKHFLPYQIIWIEADDFMHAQNKPAFALAEKSVRIGWTYADAFKNVRKRLRHKNRDYLFATKDYPSALEYMNLAFRFIDFYNFTRAVVSHGEEYLKVHQLNPEGQPTALTEEVKIGYIKFDNGSRIIAFSSNPYAMAVYGGDVGLDEFAKHPNAALLWQTAQARVTWNYDLALWSSHDGEDTLFNQFAQQARAACSTGSAGIPAGKSAKTISSPWNLYYRVCITDAIELGLLDTINRVQQTQFTPEQFLANCRTRAGSEEIFQQSYMCNPMGAATANIVEWSTIERCRIDYEIERVHLESEEIQRQFGQFSPYGEHARKTQIANFLREKFPGLFGETGSTSPYDYGASQSSALRNKGPFRLGFDVAASGQGDLAVIYIDEVEAAGLRLRALFTCRTEDWHFLKTVLFFFLKNLSSVQGAGDETGLGRQICWEAAKQYPGRFIKVNFASLKHDLGFALMNQLSVIEKRFPRNHQDIAADYFALRKLHTGTRWIFTEGRNTLNPVSHCDIAWAGALASHVHTARSCRVGAVVG
ncbi:MAG TPA: hypothetical protein VEC99_10580 [Clostridia bacterium]|nr:hypothetical protein [Clostridia bacterium]